MNFARLVGRMTQWIFITDFDNVFARRQIRNGITPGCLGQRGDKQLTSCRVPASHPNALERTALKGRAAAYDAPQNCLSSLCAQRSRAQNTGNDQSKTCWTT